MGTGDVYGLPSSEVLTGMKKSQTIGAGGLPVLPLDLGKRGPRTLEDGILVLPMRDGQGPF